MRVQLSSRAIQLCAGDGQGDELGALACWQAKLVRWQL